MYVVPQTLTVQRPFTAERVKYVPGQVIPAQDFARIRTADQLFSRHYVVPTPEPIEGVEIKAASLPATAHKRSPKRAATEPKPETDSDIQRIRDNFKKKVTDV